MHQPWHNHVKPNVTISVDDSGSFGELDNSGLGGGVCNLGFANITNSGNRGHINNGTTALLFHDREDFVAGKIDRFQIYISLGIPVT